MFYCICHDDFAKPGVRGSALKGTEPRQTSPTPVSRGSLHRPNPSLLGHLNSIPSPGRARGPSVRGTSARGSQPTPSPLSRPAPTRGRGRGRARTHADRDSSSSSNTSTSSRNLSPEKRQRGTSPDAGVSVSRLRFGEGGLTCDIMNGES